MADLLAVMYPEVSSADLELVAQSPTFESDLDDLLQSRMSIEGKIAQLRARKPKLDTPAPFPQPLPPDFFKQTSQPSTTAPAFTPSPQSLPTLAPVPGVLSAAKYVPVGGMRVLPPGPPVAKASGPAQATRDLNPDVSALLRIFGSLYTEAQLERCIARHNNNLIAAVRELLPPDSAAQGSQAPASAPVPGLPRSVSTDQTLSDPALLAATLFSVSACQRFTREGLVSLAAVLVPCTILSAVDLLRSVPSGQEQSFLECYIGQGDEPPRALPGFNCVICLEEKPVDEMAFLTCDHAFCYPDFKQHVETAINGGSLPKCPMCPGDRRLTQDEALQPFAYELTSPMIAKIEQFFLNAVLHEGGAIPCPRPGCQNAVVPRVATRKEHCVCECGFEFCSLCREVFHYETTCAEARASAGTWDAWVQTGREEHLRAKAREDDTWKARFQEYERKKEKHSRENQDAMRRRAELGRDEDWKVANCRMCPNCNRCIERMSGCDSMICGSDAHGGNAQNGCGRSFNWATAKRYEKTETGGPVVPEFGEVAPERANTDITIAEGITLTCDMCHGPITGLGFRCINCPGQFSVCLACESRVTAGGHNGHHIFRALRHGVDPRAAAAAAAAADDFDVIGLDDY